MKTIIEQDLNIIVVIDHVVSISSPLHSVNKRGLLLAISDIIDCMNSKYSFEIRMDTLNVCFNIKSRI